MSVSIIQVFLVFNGMMITKDWAWDTDLLRGLHCHANAIIPPPIHDHCAHLVVVPLRGLVVHPLLVI